MDLIGVVVVLHALDELFVHFFLFLALRQLCSIVFILLLHLTYLLLCNNVVFNEICQQFFIGSLNFSSFLAFEDQIKQSKQTELFPHLLDDPLVPEWAMPVSKKAVYILQFIAEADPGDSAANVKDDKLETAFEEDLLQQN